MPVSFPYQVNGQIADASYINDVALAVQLHDETLAELAFDYYGTGKFITAAATKATSASAADVAVTDYSLASVEIPAGRVVEFVARVRVQSTIAADAALFRLRQTSISGTIAAATPYERTLVFPWRSTGGTFTWLLTVQRITGTGSVTVTTGGATLPAIFYVRDIADSTRFTII
jgi:hypothetical protein